MEASAVFKSAYVSFPIAYTPKMFGQVMGVADTSALSDLSAVRDFIVLSGDGGDLSILAMDYNNHDKVMRYQIAYGETSAFASALEAAVSGQTSPCFIAFEYGMDEPFSPTAGSERKTTIDSYVIINDSSEKQSMAPPGEKPHANHNAVAAGGANPAVWL